MEFFLQQLVNGVALGSVYALVALGLTLVYGVLKIPNFAHGALYMLGAYVTFELLTRLNVPYALALVGSGLVIALVGVVIERLVFHQLRGQPQVQAMIAAIGLLFFFQAGAQAIWGPDFRTLPSPFEGVVSVAGANVTVQRLLVIAGAIVVMLALYYFLKRTVTGATIEAMAQNRDGARLMGINTNRVSMLTFAISAGLAAVAATLIAPINLVSPTMGDVVNLKAFAIIILGGMGSVPGAIIGGYLLALAETFTAAYGGAVGLSPDFAEMIGFVLLVVVLAVKPTGLFAKGA